MKLARFGEDASLGLVINTSDGGLILDVAASLEAYSHESAVGAKALSAALGPRCAGSWTQLIHGWSDLASHLNRMVQLGEAHHRGIRLRAVADIRLRAPLPSRRSRIFALGGNFAKHFSQAQRSIHGRDREEDSLERRRAQGPWGFLVISDTIIGPQEAVVPPRGMTKLDYEAEVAVVLGSGGRNLKASDIRIWAFTAWNDFSLRDAQFGSEIPFDRGPLSWWLQKNFDTGSSMGPWLVADEPYDPACLRIALRVNGQTRQEGSTSEMIFSFAETAAHLSQFLTLAPGDIIASGTPSGTALESGADGPFLRPGDMIEVDIEGVGTLRNWVKRD